MERMWEGLGAFFEALGTAILWYIGGLFVLIALMGALLAVLFLIIVIGERLQRRS